MSDPRESTETIVKRHVSEHVETHVTPRLDRIESTHREAHRDLMDRTEEIKTLSMEQMERIREMTGVVSNVQEASQMNTDMLLGTMPPDPDKPGIWRQVTDLDAWKSLIQKNITKIKWTFILAVIGALGTGVGYWIWFLISGDKIE